MQLQKSKLRGGSRAGWVCEVAIDVVDPKYYYVGGPRVHELYGVIALYVDGPVIITFLVPASFGRRLKSHDAPVQILQLRLVHLCWSQIDFTSSLMVSDHTPTTRDFNVDVGLLSNLTSIRD